MKGLKSFNEHSSDSFASAVQVPLQRLSVNCIYNKKATSLSHLLESRWTGCKKRAIHTQVHIHDLLLDKHVPGLQTALSECSSGESGNNVSSSSPHSRFKCIEKERPVSGEVSLENNDIVVRPYMDGQTTSPEDNKKA